MYTKGSAVEIQFSSKRLNDAAGDPFWIDLTDDEAAQLLSVLQQRVATGASGKPAPVVFNLDPGAGDEAATAATTAADGPPAELKQWVCIICGWVYDEAAGWPEDGIAPGTRWEDIPADWRCPECDVGKEDFAMVEF